jgi:hypothetical protein
VVRIIVLELVIHEAVILEPVILEAKRRGTIISWFAFGDRIHAGNNGLYQHYVLPE